MKPDVAEVQVRRMTGVDLERVMGLAALLPQAPQWPETAYRSALNPELSPRRVGLIVEKVPSGGIIGFAIASPLPPQAELETIAVAAEWQRQGMGRRLFDALAAELRVLGAGEIWLEVRASNRAAIAFYRSMGFVQTGARPRYYTDPIEDAVQMAQRLA